MYVNKETKQQQPSNLVKSVLTGAGINFVLISLFLLGTGASNPAWPEYWYLRPLLFVPIGGAVGGGFYHLLDGIRMQGGAKWWFANIVSLLLFFFTLWMSTVLGLVGTMWD